MTIDVNTKVSNHKLWMEALRTISAAQDGFIPTEKLIAKLKTEFSSAGFDVANPDGSATQQFADQVRHLGSDHDDSFMKKGYVEYDKIHNGYKITPKGRRFLTGKHD